MWDSIIGGINDMLNGILRVMLESLMVSVSKPAIVLPNDWKYAIVGTSWGYAQVLAFAALLITGIMAVVVQSKRMPAVRTLVIVLLMNLGAVTIFFRFFDQAMALSTAATNWLINMDSSNGEFGIVPGFSLSGALLTMFGIGAYVYYLITIKFLFVVLALMLVVFYFLFLPLLSLMFVSEKAHWLFNWVTSIGIVAMLLASPLVVGILAIGKLANRVTGDQSGLVAAMALVVSLFLAKRALVALMRNTHRSVSRVTNKLQASVKGQVESDWRGRPKVNAQLERNQHITAVMAAPVFLRKKEPGRVGKARHKGEAHALRALSTKILASTTPAGRAAKIAQTAAAAATKGLATAREKKAVK